MPTPSYGGYDLPAAVLEELRVCYFGTYRAGYSRNQIMIEGLRRTGVQVIECHATLWQGIEDRVQMAAGGWLKPAFWLRLLHAYAHLLRRYLQVGDYDVLVVGYPGQFDVFLARLLTWMRRKPLVWDIFMSIYLISLERGLDRRSPLTVNLLRFFERMACRLPDRLILDTAEYAGWFQSVHGVAPNRLRLVPTGADSRTFHPLRTMPVGNGAFRVVYYGTFIPNHGVEFIIEAARLLAAKNGLVAEDAIHFELIGNGPDKAKALEAAQRYDLSNVTFIDWLEKNELVNRVACAEICLGAFGSSPQSLMTIQNKIYEALAMARPVISGDSPTVRAALTHGEQIYLCQRKSGPALAAAILALRDDPALRQKLAQQGFAYYQEHASLDHLGDRFRQHLEEVLAS